MIRSISVTSKSAASRRCAMSRIEAIHDYVEEFSVHGKEGAETVSAMNTSEIVPDLFGSVEASMRELGFVKVKDYFHLRRLLLPNIGLHAPRIGTSGGNWFSTRDNIPKLFLLEKGFHLHSPVRVMRAIRELINTRARTHDGVTNAGV